MGHEHGDDLGVSGRRTLLVGALLWRAGEAIAGRINQFDVRATLPCSGLREPHMKRPQFTGSTELAAGEIDPHPMSFKRLKANEVTWNKGG